MIKPTRLTFVLLGPALSFTTLQTTALAVTAIGSGLTDAWVTQAGQKWANLASVSGCAAWLVSCPPAWLSSLCFERFLAAAGRTRIRIWFALSVAAMCVGPALMSFIIFNNLFLTLVALSLSGLLPVIICGLVARRFVHDPVAAF